MHTMYNTKSTNVWGMIGGKDQWCKVIQQKYIMLKSMEGWILCLWHNASIIWKGVVLTSPLVSNWLVWKVSKRVKGENWI